MTGLADQVLTIQVTATLGESPEDYDVAGIVRTIVERYGYIDIHEIPTLDYWDIITPFIRTEVDRP